jgi:NAD(P)-dependent dehydrogenase (short-subunit alcohol dehydrogenase family)
LAAELDFPRSGQPLSLRETGKGQRMKTILITGCSSGIGYDAAHGLKARGWRVFATCRKAEDCERLVGEGLESFVLDYADEASIAAAVAEVQGRAGRLDALFNNGAFACPGLVEDLPRNALRAIFEVNLFGYHDLTRRVIPMMRAQGAGRIVNCSSVLGFAMEGLSDALRLEMRGTGIEVILIEPGPIGTRIRQNAQAHFEKWFDWQNSARSVDYAKFRARLYDTSGKKDALQLPPSAVTKALIHAVEAQRPRARYYVTLATHFAGLARRLLPTRLLDWVVSQS